MKKLYILGSSPELNQVHSGQLEDGDTISLNYSYVAIKTKFAYSHYHWPLIYNNQLFGNSVIRIHGRWKYGGCPVADKTYNVDAFEGYLEASGDVIRTTSNVLLEVLHWSLLNKYKEVVVIGVSMKDNSYFYDRNEYDWFRKDILSQIDDIDSGEYDSIFSADVLNKERRGLEGVYSTRQAGVYGVADHTKTIGEYLRLLNKAAINVKTTSKNSVLYDAGANYIEL